jgi:uncharacterized membrane protein
MPDIRERIRNGENEDVLLRQVIETIEERAPHVLRTLSVSKVSRLQSHKWSGPLPSPDVLAQFEEIVPGCAARIIDMAEHALTASGKTLDKVADAEIVTSKRGQWMAYSLAILAMAAGVYFFVVDKPWAGATFVGLPAVLLVTSFLTGGDATIFRKVFGHGTDDNTGDES